MAQEHKACGYVELSTSVLYLTKIFQADPIYVSQALECRKKHVFFVSLSPQIALLVLVNCEKKGSTFYKSNSCVFRKCLSCEHKIDVISDIVGKS